MALMPPSEGERPPITEDHALALAPMYANPQYGRLTGAVLARYTDDNGGSGLVNRLAWIVVQTYSRPIDVKVGGYFPGRVYVPSCASYELIVLDAFDGHLLRGYPA
jgi:hypothetical protein